MAKRTLRVERIVTLLRQIEVSMAQGKPTPVACRDAGISRITPAGGQRLFAELARVEASE